jgi:hypothetical protein
VLGPELKVLVKVSDLGVVELCLGLRFVPKPFRHAGLAGHVVTQALERHLAAQLDLNGVENSSHAPFAQDMVDLVVFDDPAHSDGI